ncbi:FAD-dependent oxidoreductase [Marinobacter sp. NP-6]|uniref:protoporphyrinogen/coproporphyrinogen oxidase n=1 Tax=Marinobacter sp. NP-6 TaxID=2488666 RepID=UPI000FCB712B|nr:NAD(P)/FAD-dependent oxidoreductase [Marinobacter sp. NP-6]RUT76991.1 FAD-dependent oxidoreductase [Marinobacter sp. NP-6]
MKYIVVGGGPAGCAAAYTLSKNGHQVKMFEAENAVGGRTRQIQIGKFSVGVGALFLMGGIYPRTTALLKETGHHCQLIPWRGTSELMDNDGSRYPVSFVNLASYLRMPKLTMADRLKVSLAGVKLFLSPGAKNPFDGEDLARYDDGEDLESWSRKNLGDRPYEYIIRPLFDFLYAVPPSWLSTPFPKAIIQQAHKMRLSVPPGGPVQVSEWLVEASKDLELHLSTPVERICECGTGFEVTARGEVHKADGIVMATEAYTASELMKDFISTESYEKLRDAPYTDYAHVQIGYETNPWPDYPSDIVLPVGFGEGPRSVGAMVLQSRRQPSAVPEGGELVGVYFTTPPLEHMNDEEIKQDALDYVHRTFGKPASSPQFVKVFHYKKGLNIAKPGAYGSLDTLRSELPRNIYLAGDYFSQAGVEAAVFSGERAANQLLGQA